MHLSKRFFCKGKRSLTQIWSNEFNYWPTLADWELYVGWYIFQVILYIYLPGNIGYGQLTPGGHKLKYKTNGLNAWIVTHLVFLLGVWLGKINGSIIYDRFPQLVVIVTILGYALAVFAYLKAIYFPTHPDDCKWSGSVLYDFCMGVEMNPRIGEFDFKLFHNGRPGIVAWTVINLSFTFKQYELYGYVTNSMVVVNVIHCLYVVDLFWNEDWYLRTIDIAHDHFGWYLAWGDLTWLPTMYTLQGHYLVINPVQLPPLIAVGLLAMGCTGYIIFRMVNHQKDIFRKTNGECTIWGKKPTFVKTRFTTADGKENTSLLLTSGFWGISRHFNYVGDLVLSLAACLACGVEHILPHFYFIYLASLLVHRTFRDEHRCSAKYGKYWDDYCKVVKWRIVPYIF